MTWADSLLIKLRQFVPYCSPLERLLTLKKLEELKEHLPSISFHLNGGKLGDDHN
jgi:hypothetical protein